MIGADSLVPPYCDHDELFEVVGAYTLRPPVFGSAAADTSAIARLAQPVSNVDDAATAALYVEQPDPAPLHAVSLTRVVSDIFRVVPPTAVTYVDEAG